jgi:hypothetical protein
MDLKHDCEFLSALSPLPQWDKCWRDFEIERTVTGTTRFIRMVICCLRQSLID